MADEKIKWLVRYPWLLLGLLSLACSFAVGPLFFRELDQQSEGKRIYTIFEAKERRIRAEMERIAGQLSTERDVRKLWQMPKPSDLESKGLYYTISSQDSLLYWSSSLVAFDREVFAVRPEGILKKLPTGWFYIFEQHVDRWKIRGFLLIKRDFPYQNRYVQSSFQQDFKLSDQCEVLTTPQTGTIQVYCHEGKFHFGIQYRSKPGNGTAQSGLATLFLLLFVVFLSAHFHGRIARMRLASHLKLALAILFALVFYLFLKNLQLPSTVYSGRLFAPSHFAWGRYISSLGDYLLLSYFLFFIAQSFFVFMRKSPGQKDLSSMNLWYSLFATLYLAISSGLFLLLLNNSDISLELYSNYSLSMPNILASACIALQMIGLGAVLVRFRCVVPQKKRYQSFSLPLVAALLIIELLLSAVGWRIPYETIVFYLVVVLLLDYVGTELLARFQLTSLLVFGLLLAFGFNLTAVREGEQKRSEIQKVKAVTLATERDPAAEIFLTEFKSKVVKDSMLPTLVVPPYQKLVSHLKQNYFTGFWSSYELQVTVCAANDSVFLSDERKRYPCLSFFQQLTLSKGVILPGSDFYFMDRLNGRISYLGELHLKDVVTQKPVVAFVELNSRIIPEGKGYPQLLMDQQASRRNSNDGYSYAKYFDGKLVDRGGAYLYDPVITQDTSLQQEFNYFDKNGFTHCIYKRAGANYVVVSYPKPSLVEKGRGFPPLFLFIFLFGFCWIVLNVRLKLIPVSRMELRGKIQFTLVSTLLVLLLVIGWGLIRYNYLEFQRTLKENLDQKVRAISAELGLRVGHTSNLDTILEYLSDQLVEISEITWTDINIYDLRGKLAISSRNEIFDQGLTSDRMNPEAYQAMCLQGNALFLHNENLGKMEFFSVYAPLFNQSEELVGYVNLPYFNRQDDFTRQVTGFIVAFINLYILLVLLTMVIALAISTRLTVPLLQIEQKLKGIALGKQNAMIEYQGEDEIGRLVEAYNKKVAELSISAELLARSERESAWKGMARQIAHEINNPLTPMKLNIQYLQRIKEQGADHFDAYFDRVTTMLVAQIDTLSNIASAFSDFARMPSTRIEPVEMVSLLREMVTLFDSPEEYQISASYPAQAELFVLGDRDQFRRALVNILRNAAQAIQQMDHAAILVRGEVEGQRLHISIEDNGPGIPEEFIGRLFEPSFTTKSGGMGLGLAISRSIAENYQGTIAVTSEPGKTVFVLDLPLSD